MKKQMYVSGGGTLQKSKGFTLIELLAVIVILAIIALIATPIVLNIIKDSKENAQLRSAEFYLDAVEHSITKKMMDDPTFKPSSCEIQADGNLKCDGIGVKVEVSGEVPTSGTVDFEKGKIKDVELVLNNKTIVKDNDKWLYSGLYDADGNLIASWDELVDNYSIDIEKVYEDNDVLSPGAVLSSNKKLNKGVKLVIDSSVKKIGRYAFARNATLKEIIIPNSVTSIGYYAFYHCRSLTSITISNSVTNIGNAAFLKCTSIKKINIPNSVTSINRSVFSGCLSLKEITIPNSVTSIGLYAFDCCTSLNTINYTGTIEQWDAISKTNDWNDDIPINMVINYNYVISQN